MSRYRTTSRRTEEQKMKLNVDLRCIPEWEAELKAMPELFHNDFHFSFSKISAAAKFFLALKENDSNSTKSDYVYGVVNTQNKLVQLENALTVDKLFITSTSYSVPDYAQCGRDIVGKIQFRQNQLEGYLAEGKEYGVTSSFWVSLFTGKIDAGSVQAWRHEKANLLAILPEKSRIEDALKLLEDVSSLLEKYKTRTSHLKEKLALAEEKRAAIERFEKKHGKVFAKGAAADSKIRKRVTSLKSIVKKTKDCPYCGADLGAEPHLDHIYPVTKGGLSIVENLIWCCSTCNGLKSDKGLMQFLKEQGLPMEQTLTRLHSLGKHV